MHELEGYTAAKPTTSKLPARELVGTEIGALEGCGEGRAVRRLYIYVI